MTRTALPLILLTSLALGGCSSIIIESSSQGEAESGDGDGDGSSTTGDEESDSAGDGDGDSASGDGDGDGSGDGDGDGDPNPGDGDGDGDPNPGDGDGDGTSGDGDGDEPLLAARVLLLGDGMTDDVVTASLEAANHIVTSGGNYWDWNNDPTPGEFDVVIYVEAAWEGEGLKMMAKNALASFVEGGGALIRTEWATLGLGNSNVDMMFPVTQPMPIPIPAFAYDTTWTVEQPPHPIAAGAPASFSPTAGGCTIVEPKPGAVVVFSSDACGPALTYQEIGNNGGHVLHINDDLGADLNADPDANVLSLLNYAVSWLAVN